MTQEIIDMARQAGVYSGANEMVFSASLKAFAKLIEESATSKERDACAKVCGRLADEALVSGDKNAVACFEEAEDLIRARGQA